MNPSQPSPPWLVARGHRAKGLQRVDLFWGGSGANGFDVYRDGRRIATVSAGSYHDRLDRDGSGSYRYHIAETATATCSNDAVATFTSAGRDRARVDRAGWRSGQTHSRARPGRHLALLKE